MPSRPSWEGFLRFNLLSIPVRAFSANVTGRGRIGFHLLHKNCHSRIRYRKVCPVHGEVPKNEIVSGYEYAKGKYVLIGPQEVEKLRTENEKAISIDVFIRPDALDPVYWTGRTYYLVPDGRVAQKPYAVLQEVMADRQRYGIAQVVFAGREQVAVVRPAGNLLALTVLSYADQIKQRTAWEDAVTHPVISAKERRLAETLIDASTTEDFDLDAYKDEYTANLRKLIEAKAKGKKLVLAPTQEEPAVINLMDALRRSLDRVQQGSARGSAFAGGSGKVRVRNAKPTHAGGRRKTG